MIKVYIQSFDKDKQTQIVSQQGTNTYWFGDGELAPAKSNIDIPIVTPDQHILLNIDTASSEIPLLLSNKAIKNTGMTINDQAFVFGKQEKLAIPQFRSLCHPNDKLQKITE